MSPQPDVTTSTSALVDPTARVVLDRLHSLSPNGGGGPGGGRPGGGGPGGGRPGGGGRAGGRPVDPFARASHPLAIQPEQGDLIYLLCRAIAAARVVDFATSIGVSAIYLAAAIRDNGGGAVIGAEIVPEKVRAARANLTDAGLAEWVEIREGDARMTLRDVGGPVDFALIDGFPVASGSSLAREVIASLAPQLRVGAIVLNDNGEDDYLAFVHDPANGFRSMSLPLKGATELSVKVE